MNRKQRRAATVELPKTGATGMILQKVFESVVQHHAAEIALKSFIEGRELEGDWDLDLTARLVPAAPKPVLIEGPLSQEQADAIEAVRAHRDGDNPL